MKVLVLIVTLCALLISSHAASLEEETAKLKEETKDILARAQIFRWNVMPKYRKICNESISKSNKKDCQSFKKMIKVIEFVNWRMNRMINKLAWLKEDVTNDVKSLKDTVKNVLKKVWKFNRKMKEIKEIPKKNRSAALKVKTAILKEEAKEEMLQRWGDLKDLLATVQIFKWNVMPKYKKICKSNSKSKDCRSLRRIVGFIGRVTSRIEPIKKLVVACMKEDVTDDVKTLKKTCKIWERNVKRVNRKMIKIKEAAQK